MGHHIDEKNRFQSDKYPDLPPDKIVLSFMDPNAWDALQVLADAYKPIDPELTSDILKRVAYVRQYGPSKHAPAAKALDGAVHRSTLRQLAGLDDAEGDLAEVLGAIQDGSRKYDGVTLHVSLTEMNGTELELGDLHLARDVCESALQSFRRRIRYELERAGIVLSEESSPTTAETGEKP